VTLVELGVWILDRISLVGGKSKVITEEKFGCGQYDFMTRGDRRVKISTLERTLRRMGYRLVFMVEKIDPE
jgi:hypothetical protein